MRKILLLAVIFIVANACVSAQYVTFGRAFSFGDAFITDKDVSHQFLFQIFRALKNFDSIEQLRH